MIIIREAWESSFWESIYKNLKLGCKNENSPTKEKSPNKQILLYINVGNGHPNPNQTRRRDKKYLNLSFCPNQQQWTKM